MLGEERMGIGRKTVFPLPTGVKAMLRTLVCETKATRGLCIEE